MPRYRIYPSLLDGFQYWLDSEGGDDQEMIDKINRVRTPPSDAQLRGSAFEQVMDTYQKSVKWATDYRVHDIFVDAPIIKKMVERVQGGVAQVLLSSEVNTSHGLVEVYGYADFVRGPEVIDVKTTGNYELGKYLLSHQRPVYLEAVKHMGIHNFTFLVTDFKDVFEESYTRSAEDRERMIVTIDALIQFAEFNKDRITDKKFFAQ